MENMETTAMGEKKKSLKWIAGIIVGFIAFVVIILALVIGSVFKATSEEAELAKQFVELSAAGDYEGAFALTTPDFREVTPVSVLQEMVEANPVLDNAASVTFNIRVQENSTTIVSGTVTATDGTSSVITVYIEKDAEGNLGVVFLSLDEEDVPDLSSDDEDESEF